MSFDVRLISLPDTRERRNRARLPASRRFPDPPAAPDASASGAALPDRADETESAPCRETAAAHGMMIFSGDSPKIRKWPRRCSAAGNSSTCRKGCAKSVRTAGFSRCRWREEFGRAALAWWTALRVADIVVKDDDPRRVPSGHAQDTPGRRPGIAHIRSFRRVASEFHSTGSCPEGWSPGNWSRPVALQKTSSRCARRRFQSTWRRSSPGVIGAVFGELLAESEIGRPVQARDETSTTVFGHQIEPEMPRALSDLRIAATSAYALGVRIASSSFQQNVVVDSRSRFGLEIQKHAMPQNGPHQRYDVFIGHVVALMHQRPSLCREGPELRSAQRWAEVPRTSSRKSGAVGSLWSACAHQVDCGSEPPNRRWAPLRTTCLENR